MFIETAFMLYRHDKRGTIGLPLKPETLKVWPDNDMELTWHKEESNGRMADNESIKRKLQECIDPMNLEGSCKSA